MSCPNCGDHRFVAKPYPEESKCQNCGASFYGSDVPVFDPLVTVSIKLRSSQREKARRIGLNLSEFVREKLAESFP
jgi:transcription initiation factor TFIIIB Brf1 subunit/transcription initiation factor TFIIB